MNTNNAINKMEKFNNCFELIKLLNIVNWIRNKVTYMDDFVNKCSSLEYLSGISKLDKFNIRNMKLLFNNCLNFNELLYISK